MVSRRIRLVAAGAAVAASVWLVAPTGRVDLVAAPGTRVSLPIQARLAGYAEDMTYVTGGAYEGWIAMSVGSEVLGVPASAIASRKALRPVKLFDYLAAGPRFRPTGLVYVPTLDRFVANYTSSSANDGRFGATDALFVFDASGGLESWPLAFAEGMSIVGRPEGLAYVPADAGAFPEALRGHLLMVIDPGGGEVPPHLNVIEIGAGTFTVVQQFSLETPENVYFGDLAVLPSGSVVLIPYGDPRLFGLDVETGALAEVASVGGPTTGETLIALPDGRLAATTAWPCDFLTLSESAGAWSVTSRVPVPLGFNRGNLGGLAWDSARGRFLIGERRGAIVETESQVIAVPPTLASATLVRTMRVEPDVNYRTRLFYGLTYNSELDAAVMARNGRKFEDYRPSELGFAVGPALASGSVQHPAREPEFTDITEAVGTISGGFAPPIYNPARSNGPTALAYLADLSRYAVLMRGADGRTIHFLNADGTAVTGEAGAAVSVTISVGCPDGMRFRADQIAALAPPRNGVRYAVVGSCSAPAPAVYTDWGPPLVVLLDESGSEVARLDPFESFDMVRPAHVTFVTTGKYAGALALVNDDSIAVFRMQ